MGLFGVLRAPDVETAGDGGTLLRGVRAGGGLTGNVDVCGTSITFGVLRRGIELDPGRCDVSSISATVAGVSNVGAVSTAGLSNAANGPLDVEVRLEARPLADPE